MGYEHRENTVGLGGAGDGKHTHTHTHTHTHSVTRDTQGGWRLVQGSDAILTHVCLAPPLIKLMSYERPQDAVSLGGEGNGKHTHTVSLVRHKVDVASGIDQTHS